jgi:DNA-binding NarL/FixJ family response regulator
MLAFAGLILATGLIAAAGSLHPVWIVLVPGVAFGAYLAYRAREIVVTRRSEPATGSALTVREREVAGLLARGMATEEIAAQLHLIRSEVEALRREWSASST